MPRYYPIASGAYKIVSPYGARWGAQHLGVDMAAADGTKIYAAQGGTIQHIGKASGFGQWIVLDHPQVDGGGTTVYGHMWDAAATGLRQGQRVEAGAHIAFVGSNGQSSGPHLHFEVHPTSWRAGSQIDPVPWLQGAADPGQPTQPVAPAGPRHAAPQGDSPMTLEYLRDIRTQLTGSPDLGQFPGWQQLGGRTLVDAIASLSQRIASIEVALRGTLGPVDPNARPGGSTSGQIPPQQRQV